MKELMDKKGKSRNKKRAAHKICIHLRLQGCNLSMDRFLQALAQFIYKAPKWTLNIVGEALLSAQERSSSVLLCRLMFGPLFLFYFWETWLSWSLQSHEVASLCESRNFQTSGHSGFTFFFIFFLWLQNNVICIEFVLNHLLVRNVFGSKLLVAYILWYIIAE